MDYKDRTVEDYRIDLEKAHESAADGQVSLSVQEGVELMDKLGEINSRLSVINARFSSLHAQARKKDLNRAFQIRHLMHEIDIAEEKCGYVIEQIETLSPLEASVVANPCEAKPTDELVKNWLPVAKKCPSLAGRSNAVLLENMSKVMPLSTLINIIGLINDSSEGNLFDDSKIDYHKSHFPSSVSRRIFKNKRVGHKV